jgi:hypothetical protein
MAEVNAKVVQHVQGSVPLAPNVRCPFRTPERRKQFEGMVKDYRLRNRTLFRFPAGENRSNNIGEAFWRGFHAESFIWDREAPLFVAYRAGEVIRAMALPVAGLSDANPNQEALPPYIYGREAAPDERVWTEASVRQITSERDSLRRRLDALIAGAGSHPSGDAS